MTGSINVQKMMSPEFIRQVNAASAREPARDLDGGRGDTAVPITNHITVPIESTADPAATPRAHRDPPGRSDSPGNGRLQAWWLMTIEVVEESPRERGDRGGPELLGALILGLVESEHSTAQWYRALATYSAPILPSAYPFGFNCHRREALPRRARGRGLRGARVDLPRAAPRRRAMADALLRPALGWRRRRRAAPVPGGRREARTRLGSSPAS